MHRRLHLQPLRFLRNANYAIKNEIAKCFLVFLKSATYWVSWDFACKTTKNYSVAEIRVSLLFHHFPDNLLEIFLLHGTHLHGGIALQRDKEEGRNAADAEDGSQLGFLVDIHLIEIYLAGIFPG